MIEEEKSETWVSVTEVPGKWHRQTVSRPQKDWNPIIPYKINIHISNLEKAPFFLMG